MPRLSLEIARVSSRCHLRTRRVTCRAVFPLFAPEPGLAGRLRELRNGARGGKGHLRDGEACRLQGNRAKDSRP